MRTLSPPVVLAAMVAAIVGVAVTGCPERECTHLTDCPSGQLCDSTGTCVVDNSVPPPPYDGGPGGDGGPGFDAGPGSDGGVNENLRVPLVEQLNASVIAIMEAPGDPATALVATYNSGGGLDEVGELDIATHQMAGSPWVDFANIGGGCYVDEMHFFADSGAVQLPQADEYWFSCSAGGGALIYYTGLTFSRSYRDPLIDQIDLVSFVDSGDDTNGDARVVFAERGGTELKVVRFEPTDQESAPRGIEPVAADVEFDAIAGIFKVVEGDNQRGDIVLVFDRGGAGALPRLIPIQRNYGQLTWHGPPIVESEIATITLPAGTHGALFREVPGIPEPSNLTTGTADNDIPNVLITLPADTVGGKAIFFRYERENGKDLSVTSIASGFPEVQLGGASMPSTVASATDKLLLRETNFGATAFAYVLTGAAVGFSIPLPSGQGDDVTNDVARGAFQSTSDRPTALLPVSASRMLIGFGNKNEIHQVGFSDQF